MTGPLDTGQDGPLDTAAGGRVLWTAEHVEALRRRFDADADGLYPDGLLRCPLPGHSGLAFVDLAPDGEDPVAGELRLLCCRDRWRSLGEVRAALAYGADNGGRPHAEGGRSNIELATWTRLLAFEVG